MYENYKLHSSYKKKKKKKLKTEFFLVLQGFTLVTMFFLLNFSR